jgi:16S rRNA G966 N2-methylase RsmD
LKRSAGASSAGFSTPVAAAVRTIQENLRITRLESQARVERVDSMLYLRNEPSDGFEYIYIAPPQYHGLWRTALELIDARPTWLLPDGVEVVQIDPKEYVEVPLRHLRLMDQRSTATQWSASTSFLENEM